MIRVGISACFFYPDPKRATFSKKTLLYYEQQMAHWVMNHGGYPILLPTVSDKLSLNQIMGFVDGLLLHGGADVAPESYGEKPINENWLGDAFRDQYEINLYREARLQNKPILGICRGLQIINVAEGGTLYQDINTQVKGSRQHRDSGKYDKLFHQVNIGKNTCLSHIYALSKSRVNSIHHQAVKDLGADLVVEAWCSEDQIIEGICHKSSHWEGSKKDFVLAVQWHPEFMQGHTDTLNEAFLMKAFLKKLAG